MLSTWRVTGRLPRWPTWFTKELSDVVRSHLAVHHVGLLLYRLVYHLVHNHPLHYLTLSRCHIKILSVYLEKLSWPAGVSNSPEQWCSYHKRAFFLRHPVFCNFFLFLFSLAAWFQILRKYGYWVYVLDL